MTNSFQHGLGNHNNLTGHEDPYVGINRLFLLRDTMLRVTRRNMRFHRKITSKHSHYRGRTTPTDRFVRVAALTRRVTKLLYFKNEGTDGVTRLNMGV